MAARAPPRPRIWEMVEYLHDEVMEYEKQLEPA